MSDITTTSRQDEVVSALDAFEHFCKFPGGANAEIVRTKIKQLTHDRDVWLAMTHTSACSQCNENYGRNLCDYGKTLMETARPGSTTR